MEGYTYHLTQRCHNRSFLMRFARDRDAYRKWLREGVRRFQVPIYGFCITSNHVHVIAHALNREAVSALMHLASGATAKQFNLRKEREGSMWEHPYQCTIIQDGRHLLNCLCYLDLNMVRAGKVKHPREWRWCGYDELMGCRQRYTLLNTDSLQVSLGIRGRQDLRECYGNAIEKRLSEGHLAREEHWTTSLAVGTQDFIGYAEDLFKTRQKLTSAEVATGDSTTWTLYEEEIPYNAF